MRYPILLFLLATACVSDADRIAQLFDGRTEWTDLTYPFNAETIYWPTAESFTLERVSAGVTAGGYYYAANNFRAAEHGGTHLDAPVHFAEGRQSTAEIPLSRLIGPAVVIDVTDGAARDPDYLVSVRDIERHEAAYGPLPDGAVVLFRTGWGQYWPSPERYLGTAARGDGAVAQLHFPGIDPAVARWLVAARRVDAVGIDTPSIDYGQSTTFETHRVLFAANIPAFENVANLERLPERGAYVIALPMKIDGGSGGPLRMVGVVP